MPTISGPGSLRPGMGGGMRRPMGPIPQRVVQKEGPRTPPPPRREKPPELDQDLIRQCREFLSIEVPASNIVFVEEFARYMPLFNKELAEHTEPGLLDDIARDYNSRFSMQHPIQILSREIDPQGVYSQKTRKRHKLDRTIPAMFRRVSTLNDLGKKIPSLMNAFFNATSKSSGPGDIRKGDYAQQIAEAIAMADDRTGKIKEQRAAFRQGEQALMKGQTGGKTPEAPSEDSTTGIIEWE